MSIKSKSMYVSGKPGRSLSYLVVIASLAAAASAVAADRLQSGEWEVTYSSGTSVKVCLKPADVELANGDEKTMRTHLAQKFSGSGRCAFIEVKVSGDRVAVTATCGGTARTETTNYHGDSYESENSTGMTAHAKRIGACS